MTDFYTKGKEAFEQERKKQSDTVKEVTFVVRQAWEAPFTTKSDFAREHASHVAAASCLGFITTAEFCPEAGVEPIDNSEDFGSVWRVTARGAVLLSNRITRGD